MEHVVIYHTNYRRGMFVAMVKENNFLVFESYEINSFHVGDILSGKFSECGPAEITNSTTLKSHQIVIQNVGLDSTMAIAKADLDD